MERADVDAGVDWFHRHGRVAVFTGRLLPGIRSLVSIPAGAEGMPRWQFQVFTIAGSGPWNVTLVLAGWLLGSDWALARQVASWVNVGLVVGLVLVVARWAWRKWRRPRQADA